MEEGGVPLSHLLSRKEKVNGAARGHGHISVDSASLRQRGRLTGASGGHCQLAVGTTQLLTAKHKETHALYTQMGLSVSRSPFLALAQEGQPTTQ